ncbi:MAG: ABC transporter substrate-binding protein [Rhodospirillales bacterium]|nr:ABC transporter substrate-binding protein [Rhodospirillales bacterium]
MRLAAIRLRDAALSLFAALLCLPGVAAAQSAPSPAPAHIRFGIDWKAEAEYGGYYEAKALGLYAKHGLDVTIQEGGPEINHTQMLLAGRLDFDICSNSFVAFNFVQQHIPFRAVAAMFQKDPSVLIAHPGVGNDSFPALKGKPILISADTRIGWWNFLKAKFGYSDSQIRPYTFNLAPFLANKNAIQQGFLGSEPYSIEHEAHFKPVVLLVADAGFKGYASLICTSDARIKSDPSEVQRFVDASIEGWYAYLNGDPGPANALIKKANPEMTDGLLAYGRQTMKDHGILQSGDAATLGIGAMTKARWDAFYKAVSEEGIYPKGMDISPAYTLQFVDHKTGLKQP